MNLEKKKVLAARTLGVGKKRVRFNTERLTEIKEAITKQDIRDLYKDGAIFIREITGRKKTQERNWRRRAGSIRHKKKRSKQDYMILTRKLRSYISDMLRKKLISKEQYYLLRKQIRASMFKSKGHLKEVMASNKPK